MPTQIDPRYDNYTPTHDPEKCELCLEDEATQKWITLDGEKKVCDYCVNYGIENETNYLIEKL